MKYEIGMVMQTEAFGLVQVIDAFRSIKTNQYCYQVMEYLVGTARDAGSAQKFLCWEEDLV